MSGSRHDLIVPNVTSLNPRLSRRRLTQLGAAASAAALFGGLPRLAGAQEATPAAVEVTPYNGEKVTITYGYWDSAQSDAIKAQIDAFKAHFPNITVEPQIVPWADYWTQLQTAVGGGKTFDVFWINTASLPVYASVNALLPITSIVGERWSRAVQLPRHWSNHTHGTACNTASHEISIPGAVLQQGHFRHGRRRLSGRHLDLGDD